MTIAPPSRFPSASYPEELPPPRSEHDVPTRQPTPASAPDHCDCPSVQLSPGAGPDRGLRVGRHLEGGTVWVSLTGDLDLTSVQVALRLVCEHCSCDRIVVNASALRVVDPRAADIVRGAWSVLASRCQHFEILDPYDRLAVVA